jgi:hypothetical protein
MSLERWVPASPAWLWQASVACMFYCGMPGPLKAGFRQPERQEQLTHPEITDFKCDQFLGGLAHKPWDKKKKVTWYLDPSSFNWESRNLRIPWSIPSCDQEGTSLRELSPVAGWASSHRSSTIGGHDLPIQVHTLSHGFIAIRRRVKGSSRVTIRSHRQDARCPSLFAVNIPVQKFSRPQKLWLPLHW